MKTVHLPHIATVIIPRDFDCKNLSNINKRPECIMFNSGFSIGNNKFPQILLPQKIEAKISFESLDGSMSMLNIIVLACQKMGGGKNAKHDLVLRSLYSLMKANDLILETIKGKRIIIPTVSKESDDMNLKVIVFEPIYQHEPVWGIELLSSYEITGHNAVVPIIFY